MQALTTLPSTTLESETLYRASLPPLPWPACPVAPLTLPVLRLDPRVSRSLTPPPAMLPPGPGAAPPSAVPTRRRSLSPPMFRVSSPVSESEALSLRPRNPRYTMALENGQDKATRLQSRSHLQAHGGKRKGQHMYVLWRQHSLSYSQCLLGGRSVNTAHSTVTTIHGTVVPTRDSRDHCTTRTRKRAEG